MTPAEDDASGIPHSPADARSGRLTRRALLAGLGVGVSGLAVGAAAGCAAGSSAASEPSFSSGLGGAVEAFYGDHQAGIATSMQSSATLLALDLRRGIDREALVRMMRLLTDDIARLSEGRPALADPEPELATVPARLTVTVGFGSGLLGAAGRADESPSWLADGLPRFAIDRLRDSWSGGDLLLQVAAEDPVTVSHAVRVLTTDAGPFATVRWRQRGFHRPANTAPAGITGRNLMGQVDGTENPKAGTADFDSVVWIPAGVGPAWLQGGSSVVVRRVAMDLRTWGGLDVATKEQAIGRRLSDGAPLTGGTESTAPDFDAVDEDGFLVIPPTSHIRLAHAQASNERILRRPYNYDDGFTADGSADAGLVFVAYMADPAVQFVPIQRRLAESDVLNLWTTPIGSALFAVPPGISVGEYVGQGLLA